MRAQAGHREEKQFKILKDYKGPRNRQVRGGSMASRYENGETVVCSLAKGWKSGDYCVVIKKDGEALVKKVKEDGQFLILSSMAPGHEPIILHKKDVRAIHETIWKKER